MPSSCAMASRWSTPLVDPPVAATEAMALSMAARVMIWDGRVPPLTSSMTSSPARRAASSLPGSVAGIPFRPPGEMPMNSSAVLIVFAVNWPPHAPGPGHAASSISRSSSREIFPARYAPIASNTVTTVASRFPRTTPGLMVPL